MVKRILILFVVLWPGMVLAGTCNSTYCEGKITTLYPNGSTGKVYVRMDGVMTALGCTLDQGQFIVLKQTNQLHSEIYSMLLSAILANRDIRVRIVENSSDCELMYTMLK